MIEPPEPFLAARRGSEIVERGGADHADEADAVDGDADDHERARPLRCRRHQDDRADQAGGEAGEVNVAIGDLLAAAIGSVVRMHVSPWEDRVPQS